MNRAPQHRQRRFLHRLAQRRRRVCRDRDVLARDAVLNSEYDLLNQIAGVGTGNVTAEQFIGDGSGDDLDEAIGLTEAPRATAGGEGEFAGLAGAA